MTATGSRAARHAAYDEIIATAVKREHEPQQLVGDLLHAEISESEPLCAIGSRTMASARSVKYQMTIAKLPQAKEIDEFDFDDTPVNETLVALLHKWGVRGFIL